MTEKSRIGILKSSFGVSLATLLSRVLGLVRVMFEARVLGGGSVASAWFLAFESKEAPNCEELREKIAFYLEKVAQQRDDLDRLEAHLRSLLDRFVLPDETPLTTEPERYEAGLKSKGRFLDEPKS